MRSLLPWPLNELGGLDLRGGVKEMGVSTGALQLMTTMRHAASALPARVTSLLQESGRDARQSSTSEWRMRLLRSKKLSRARADDACRYVCRGAGRAECCSASSSESSLFAYPP